MNMKPVELQIAVPRTSEATRIQQDQQYRPISDQALLATQSTKELEQSRKRSAQVDESGINTIIKRDDDHPSSSGHDQTSQEHAEQESEKKHPAEHPYKGKTIDLSF